MFVLLVNRLFANDLNGLVRERQFLTMISVIFNVFGMLVNMSIVLALELRELVAATSLAPSLGAYWIPTGAYWLVPLYVLDRLVREQIMTQLLTRSGRKAS